MVETGETVALGLPRSNVLTFDLEDGCRVIARPSGTEPKIKFYFEVIVSLTEEDTVESVAMRANARIDALRVDLLQQVGL